jgi:hypothetical protein
MDGNTVSLDSAATDRLSGGIIRFKTACFNSCEYFDISRHLPPPARSKDYRKQ